MFLYLYSVSVTPHSKYWNDKLSNCKYADGSNVAFHDSFVDLFDCFAASCCVLHSEPSLAGLPSSSFLSFFWNIALGKGDENCTIFSPTQMSGGGWGWGWGSGGGRGEDDVSGLGVQSSGPRGGGAASYLWISGISGLCLNREEVLMPPLPASDLRGGVLLSACVQSVIQNIDL